MTFVEKKTSIAISDPGAASRPGRQRRSALLNARNSILLVMGAVAIGVLVQCGGGGSSSPSGGTTVTTVGVATTTTTTVPARIVLPAGMVCDPTPPPLRRVLPQMWRPRGNGWILDTKPQVMNVDNYCERTGQGSGSWCDTRIEGDSQREACDYLAVGQASDTGRWGPTWTYNGKPCDPPGAEPTTNCNNYPDNQFKAIARGSGLYEACASALAKVDPVQGERCGQVLVP
jgi:hypothetical protein